MMSNPAIALNKAVIDALRAHAPLVAALGGAHVYDQVPQGREPPYVHVSGIELNLDDAGCYDGEEATVTLQCWSRLEGRRHVRELAGLVRDALHHASLDLSAFGCALHELRVTAISDFAEADGRTKRAVLTLRADVQRLSP